MAKVVRLDTNEEIGYFVELYGPLPAGRHGYFLDAWRYPDGTLQAQAPASQGAATPVKINLPVLQPERGDCTLVVTPTYLDFMLGHPAFRPLPPRPAKRRPWWQKAALRMRLRLVPWLLVIAVSVGAIGSAVAQPLSDTQVRERIIHESVAATSRPDIRAPARTISLVTDRGAARGARTVGRAALPRFVMRRT